LFQANDNRIDKLKEKVSRININETTPLQSMETLNELVKLIESS
jgi:hypothetical protein